MDGLEGRTMEEQIGLSTAGGRFLFEMSKGVSELAASMGW